MAQNYLPSPEDGAKSEKCIAPASTQSATGKKKVNTSRHSTVETPSEQVKQRPRMDGKLLPTEEKEEKLNRETDRRQQALSGSGRNGTERNGTPQSGCGCRCARSVFRSATEKQALRDRMEKKKKVRCGFSYRFGKYVKWALRSLVRRMEKCGKMALCTLWRARGWWWWGVGKALPVRLQCTVSDGTVARHLGIEMRWSE